MQPNYERDKAQYPPSGALPFPAMLQPKRREGVFARLVVRLVFETDVATDVVATAAGEVSDAEGSRQCHDDLRLAAKAA